MNQPKPLRAYPIVELLEMSEVAVGGLIVETAGRLKRDQQRLLSLELVLESVRGQELWCDEEEDSRFDEIDNARLNCQNTQRILLELLSADDPRCWRWSTEGRSLVWTNTVTGEQARFPDDLVEIERCSTPRETMDWIRNDKERWILMGQEDQVHD